MAEATEFANSISQKENDDAIAAMKKAGTTTFHEQTPAESEEWKKAIEPVTTTWHRGSART